MHQLNTTLGVRDGSLIGDRADRLLGASDRGMHCRFRLVQMHSMLPNNSLKPTRLAGENAVVPCLRGWPTMKA